MLLQCVHYLWVPDVLLVRTVLVAITLVQHASMATVGVPTTRTETTVHVLVGGYITLNIIVINLY